MLLTAQRTAGARRADDLVVDGQLQAQFAQARALGRRDARVGPRDGVGPDPWVQQPRETPPERAQGPIVPKDAPGLERDARLGVGEKIAAIPLVVEEPGVPDWREI